MLSNKVLTERKNVQLCQVVKALNNCDPVWEKWEICKLCQVVQPFDLLDEVEAEIEPSQIHEMVKILNLANDIVV